MKKSLITASIVALAASLAGCVDGPVPDIATGTFVGAGTGAAIGGLATGHPGGAIAGAAIGGATGAIAGAAYYDYSRTPHYSAPVSVDDYEPLTTGPARCLREGYDVQGRLVCLRWSAPYYRYVSRSNSYSSGW